MYIECLPEHPGVGTIEKSLEFYSHGPRHIALQQDRVDAGYIEPFCQSPLHARLPNVVHAVQGIPCKSFPHSNVLLSAVHS